MAKTRHIVAKIRHDTRHHSAAIAAILRAAAEQRGYAAAMTSRDPDRPFTPSSWDDRYAGDDYLFGTEANQFLVRCRSLLGGDDLSGVRVLCVADGEGRNSVWLAGQGCDVDAFDPSPVAVAKARRLAARRGVGVRFAVADAESWDWRAGAYDVVAAIFVQFAGPALRRRMFDRIAHTLRPGGLFLLEGYGVDQLAYGTGGPRTPENLYTADQLRSELGAFDLDQVREYHAEVEEGPGHSGMSALVDVIGRRRASDGE
jgi:SAM-dependent methyltransferase